MRQFISLNLYEKTKSDFSYVGVGNIDLFSIESVEHIENSFLSYDYKSKWWGPVEVIREPCLPHFKITMDSGKEFLSIVNPIEEHLLWKSDNIDDYRDDLRPSEEEY